MTLSGSTCYERMRLIEVSWAVTSSGIMGKRDGEEDGECPLLQIHQSGQGGCFQLGYIENARRGWITTTEVSARGFLLGWFDPEVMGSPCDAVLCYRFPQTKTSKKGCRWWKNFNSLELVTLVPIEVSSKGFLMEVWAQTLWVAHVMQASVIASQKRI